MASPSLAPVSADAAPWQLRAARDEEWPVLLGLLEHAFGGTMSAAERELERSVAELDRVLVALDGELIVGTTAILSHDMTVPGATRPVASVTGVGVLPTHRRRGILGTLMRAQLRQLHEAGAEATAALWASEAAIYGRYGYGPASRQLNLTVRRSPGAVIASPPDPGLRLRLVPAAQTVDLVEAVYDVVRARRPGMHRRDARWRARELFDAPDARRGASELRCVVAADDAGVRGYARYRVQEKWGPQCPDGTVHVRELFGGDLAAEAALLRFLVDLDLTSTVRLMQRPVDDPLLDLLTDLRGAVPTLLDGLYIRVVDVDRALCQRSYAQEVDLVLEVDDPLCPWNTGRWHLSAGPDGASCARTHAGADVVLPVRTLGAAYLGSAGVLERLARAGQAHELSPGALRRASQAFSWPFEPWAPFVW